MELNGQRAPFYDADLRILTFTAQGPIQFCLAINNEQAEYEVVFTRNTMEYRPIRGKDAYLTASAGVQRSLNGFRNTRQYYF